MAGGTAGLADVLAPDNEEGTKATILKWCKAAGDMLLKDEPLLELETDKVTVEIPSPATGQLAEILKQPNEEVLPGQLLARIRIDAESGPGSEAAGANGAPRMEQTAGDGAEPRAQAPGVQAPGVQAPGASAAPPADDGRGRLSPAVRRMLRENALRADDIAGSGRDVRITAQDVARRLTASPTETRVPHTPIRRRVAEHMVRSLGAAPYTAYFVAACARARAANPQVNATYHEDALELHSDANIGVGTALGNEGLIVPVIHAAQNLDLPAIAAELGRVVAAARTGKLTPQDVRGGTFTLSNHGVSGSLLAAPIVINQPQVAILGVGKVERRVCVIESGGAESIGIRTQCYLTLTIDHRALDAFQANAFLSQVVAALEQWAED